MKKMCLPVWVKFSLTTMLFVIPLSGCSGGNSESSRITNPGPSIPDGSGVKVQKVNGTVALPPDSSIKLENLTINTPFGSQGVGTNGRFSVPANRAANGIVTAVDNRGLVRLLQVARPSGDLALSPKSTALALLLINPLLANANEGDPARTQSSLLALTEFTALENAVTALIKSGSTLEKPSSSLNLALKNAVTAGVRALGGGIQGQAISPGTAQSGVALVSGNDTNPRSIEVTVENSYRRHVQVWYAGANSAGQAIEPLKPLDLGDLPGLVGSPPDFSGLSILTGQVARPKTAKGTVSIPTNATQVRIEVWGPGFREASSVSSSEFLQRAQGAVGFSILFDYLGPVVNTFLGVKVLSPNLDRETRRAALALVSQPSFVAHTRAYINGDQRGALLGMLKDLVTSDTGKALLGKSATALGTSAAFKVAFKQFFKFYAIYELTMSVADTVRALYSLVNARPREVFFVSSGNSAGGIPFRASLSWNQPNDIDLHTFGPNGQHSYFDRLAIQAGSLNLDDRNGFGPENFTADKRLPGIYRIAVNYYSAGEQNNDRVDSRSSACTLIVSTGNGTRSFTYNLRQSNGNSGYPIRGNTASWWRPCDIRVNANGTVDILPPDTSFALNSSISTLSGSSTSRKKPN